MKTKLLATTLLVGMSGGIWSSAAIAQDATDDEPIAISDGEDDEEAVQETVVITGSRLRRPVDETIAVTTIGADQIKRRSFTNVINAIEELPLAGIGTNINGATLANNDSTANANLLNLGTNRTLTLVNGRRFVSSNQATVFVPGNANGAQVDLSLINPALIESSDIVAGSAGGATYGADAVGGVVNINLIDDYDGYEVDGQFGVTDFGDGKNFRLSGIAGKNFYNDRANITFALEYSDINSITTEDPGRVQGRGFTGIINPEAGPGVPSTLILPGGVNPFLNPGGLLVGASALGVSANNAFFPTAPNANFPGGLSPFEFAQTSAGQGINPLLFVGTFGGAGSFLTIPNTDAATNGFLPDLAVPLQFDTNGNLVPVNLGAITPPGPADQNTVFFGDGITNGSIDTIRGEQERLSATVLTRFDITDDITYKAEYLYANIENSLIDGFLSNVPNGSTAAGSFSVPVFIDENPFLNAQAVGTINGLVGQGLNVPTVGGSRALFLSRAFLDVLGPVDESSVTDFYRTSQEIGGDFDFLDRALYWNTSFSFGRVDRVNNADTLLDIEFALAVDAVDDGNGNIVCRQQTLAAPESIADRNPLTAFINTALPSITPTQAQVDACQPLNLFGNGAPSQAAIDFVSSSTQSSNRSQQFQYTAEFGGEAIELPAGAAIFNTQFEWRREENEFTPGETFAFGTGRATTGQASQGALEFLEGGLEVSIPILGEGFNFLGADRLEFDGAVRVVSRTGGSATTGLDSARVTDVVYSAGGRYSPIKGLTIRGSQSTSIRSASVVELFGAGVTGFSGAFRGNGNPCDVDSIDGGPDGGIRRTNCEAFAAQLGLPADFLDTFQAVGGAAPAAGASNPLLDNEQSSTWTVGAVFQPSFIPGLTISGDYYNLNLDDIIQLTSISNQCFDQPDFPNSIVNGLNSCNAVLIGLPDPANPGQFIVPGTNPITGAPVVSPAVNIGAPAQTQAPLNSTFAFFDTVNLAAQRLESVNFIANYRFALEDVFGDTAANWGDLNLNGTLYWLANFDDFGSEAAVDLGLNDPLDGEPGNPEFSSVFNVTHNVGRLSHNVQWIRSSATVGNVQIDDRSTQAPNFELPDTNIVNYNASFDVTDNVRVRFVVNNLADFRLAPDVGVVGALGRSFVFGVNARF